MISFISKNRIYIWSFFAIIIQTLFGLLYSNISYSINWTAYSVTLIFFLINHLVELYLAPSSQKKVTINFSFLALLDIIIFLALIYFIISTNIQAALLPLAYTILIHIQYFFIYYKLEKIGTVAVTLFKGLLIPVITYYIQNQFITYSLILYSIPFIFYIFILEFLQVRHLIREDKKTIFSHPVVVRSYLPLTLLFSIIIAWQAVSWWALLLLLLFFIYQEKFKTAFVYLPVDTLQTTEYIFLVYFGFSFFYLFIFLVGL